MCCKSVELLIVSVSYITFMGKMKRFFLLCLVITANRAFAQESILSICKDSLSVFSKNMIYQYRYTMYDTTFTIKFTDSINQNGRIFFLWQYTRDSTWYSEGRKGEIYVYDEVEKKEKLLIPFEEIIGFECILKKEKYVINDYHGTFSTPYCTYNNVVCIDIYDENGRYHFRNYFKKGIGYVGFTWAGKKLAGYLVNRERMK